MKNITCHSELVSESLKIDIMKDAEKDYGHFKRFRIKYGMTQNTNSHPNPLSIERGNRTNPPQGGGKLTKSAGGVGAFTLVELIVVIVIISILGTISFISVKNYTAGARDVKRLSDVKSLLGKITYEVALGTNLDKMMETLPQSRNINGITIPSGTNQVGVIINGETAKSNIGILNFSKLKENQENFLDPLTNEPYLFAYSTGTTTYNGQRERYKFVELATINETKGVDVVVGDYVKYLQNDSPSLFKIGASDTENDYIVDGNSTGSTDLPLVGECSGFKVSYLPQIYNGGINMNSVGVYTKNQTWQDIKVENCAGSGYIIMDRNLGATSNDYNSTSSYGYYYQWGNNYGFPNTGSVLTGATQVDTTGYGPGKYYYSDTFILDSVGSSSQNWSSPQNDNLWGGLGDYYTRGNCTDGPGTSYEGRQGPCPSGRHVPSLGELRFIIATQQSQNTLKLPFAGSRDVFYTINGQGSVGNYWSSSLSSINSHDSGEAGGLYLSPSDGVNRDHMGYVFGNSIRCFKNYEHKGLESWCPIILSPPRPRASL